MSEQDEIVNVPISAERLLAAFLSKFGEIEVSVDQLLDDYSNYQVAVEQGREGYVTFKIVELDDEASE